MVAELLVEPIRVKIGPRCVSRRYAVRGLERYTWGVLSDSKRGEDVVEAIRRELCWGQERL